MDREIAAVRTALESDYDVVAELGRGGMAVVYLAHERQLDREVAIKVLRPALAADNEFVERFKHEARTAGKLEHPNIVPIYRVGQSGHVIYFVMKYLRGQSLGAVLRERGKLHVPEVRRILLETASALGFAAKQNVVHRDIKPDNILLDHEGRCVVTDFGIAKGPGGTHTAPGTSLGTPRYMSPEHAQGTPLDGRSDMYSLGVVAFQCLLGRTPFDADDAFAILYKHINEPIPRPTFESPDEEQLYFVIERMLAKKADARFQSASELILALGGEVTGPILADASGPLHRALLTPTLPMHTPLPFSLRERLRRVPPMWLAAVSAAVIVLAILGISMARRPRVVARADSAATTRRLATAGVGNVGSTTGVIPSGTAATPAGAGATGSVTPGALASGTGTTSAAGTPAGGLTTLKTASATSAATRQSPPPTAAVHQVPRPAAQPFSKCPRVAANAATKDLSLLVDSIPNQTTGADLNLAYDVCGLAAGSPFSAQFTVRKLNQSRFGRLVGHSVGPTTINVPEVASGPRSRKHKTISLTGLPAGNYAMDVAVTDAKGRQQAASKSFVIVDK